MVTLSSLLFGATLAGGLPHAAENGVYQEYAVKNMPSSDRRRHFTHNKEDNTYCLRDDIRRIVKFEFHNLRDPFRSGHFDVVFLRNVLMYFDCDMKRRVLENVFAALRPGGMMITGDVDPLRDGSDLRERSGLEFVCSNTYRKPIANQKPTEVA